MNASTAATVRVARETLLAALQRATVVASRAKLPIASGVHCSVADGRMTLTATDLDQTIATSIPVDGADGLVFVVPAKSFQTIVAQLPLAPIDLTIEERGRASLVEITAGRARFELAGLDPEQFPTRSESPDAKPIELAAPWLLAAINRASTFLIDEGSPWKQGVCVALGDGFLTVAGSDGHAGHRERIPLETKARGEWILPALTAETVVRIFAKAETLRVVLDVAGVEFSDSVTTITSRVIQEPYPNLNQVYAPALANEQITITADREALSSTIKRVASLPGKFVAVRFTVVDGELTINARDDGGSVSCDALPVAVERKKKSAEEFAIAFSPLLIQRCIAAVGSEQVRLLCSSSTGPVLVVDAKPHDQFTGAMLAPVRLQATEPPSKSRQRKGEF